jgi:hypothetical protein
MDISYTVEQIKKETEKDTKERVLVLVSDYIRMYLETEYFNEKPYIHSKRNITVDDFINGMKKDVESSFLRGV